MNINIREIQSNNFKIMNFHHLMQIYENNYHLFKFRESAKKTAPRAVFFENFIQLQNTLESLQIILRTF